MSPRVDGDAQLGLRLAELLGRRHPAAAAAVVTPSAIRMAAHGADLDSDFELASVSKGLTGLLYADALARGEVRPGTTLGELLPLDGTPVARARLDALSTHRAGLPRLPSAAQPWRRTFQLWRHGTNPYRESLDELLGQARGVRVRRRVKPRYSNIGFELLGHAVAAAAGTTYAELVAQRLAGPLELSGLYVPADASELRQTALAGHGRRGQPREPWANAALGPAGGVRASIRDLGRLLEALLDGTAPGVAALEPVARFGTGARIGAGWLTTKLRGREITWHNGGSGGFRSWVGLDRAADAGVAVLSATAVSVDGAGFRLLTPP
ncbi:serine hydrolase domain-containing protein [Jiangella alkaliphila]|uniref:CubicO group peptidase, beta-lactamase class C family n=1 Tax=Jiangella alkaliphila TaxID=419479 RepID=A0A1H2KXS2_9ACTN|nr:serine hydrolase domain-containing protein [Jiangella alkaliphila]SDU73294.1 CubicO group peptidase, beta-lactamase class C family [Jiangella alkaliphila]